VSAKKKILVQFDGDPQPSVFDGVVAVDAGIDFLFRHGGMTRDQVRDLVYGCLFTRGPKDLSQTAIFVGGSDVGLGESLAAEARAAFFGPFRVSLLVDPNGANTTAAAAVLCACRHLSLSGTQALVLAGTGPVGQRVARLLARAGAAVRLASRQIDRAAAAADAVRRAVPDAELTPVAATSHDELHRAFSGVSVVVAAGAPKALLAPESVWKAASSLRAAIDLNAVPPTGLEGIEPGDHAVPRGNIACYGALGVGGLKMKIHKRAIARLFESNDQFLDAEAVFELGRSLESGTAG
jgi:hypothetical protein